jgi:acyl-phosphate glycerol 3-phosphate acyltransferase
LVSLAVAFSTTLSLITTVDSIETAISSGTISTSTAAQPIANLTSDPFADLILQYGSGIFLEVPMALAVVACVMGHMFSPFMGFKGGKGVATALGTLIVVIPLPALCAFAVFGIFALITRIVSIGSIAAVISLPIFTAVFYPDSITYIILTILIALIVIFAHHKNIVRIFKGEEPRFHAGKKKEDQ